jgi:transposase-like protein
MKRESRIVDRSHQVDSLPVPRHLPLVDLLVDARAELMELAVVSGLKVLHTMLEEDRIAVCGARYAHQANRQAVRGGTVSSEVVLGGRKVAIRRPRVRADGHEVILPTFQAFADTDPLNRRVVEQMLVGVATRQYGRSLEPTGADIRTRGTSKSAVSRRFVAKTSAQLETWRATSLETLDLVTLLVDSVHVDEHCVVVALGIDASGKKHALGLWEGATENTTVCQSLLANLQSRGLRTDRSLLVILDGSKALHRAITQLFGRAALIQRCQVHKRRNVLEHLPERQRPWVRAIFNRAYHSAEVATARRLLLDLGRRLQDSYPSAAESVHEGLDETLTVLSFGISERLRHSLATTNAIESLLSRTRHVKRNVKRWRGGTMVVRWVAAGILEATNGFRRLQGKADMPKFVAALRSRDQQLGLGDATENVA